MTWEQAVTIVFWGLVLAAGMAYATREARVSDADDELEGQLQRSVEYTEKHPDQPFLRVVSSEETNVVCTWCGAKFVSRRALESHWELSARCGTNRFVNNPTQEKNLVWSDDDE